MDIKMLGVTNVQLINNETGEIIKIDKVEKIEIEHRKKQTQPFFKDVEGKITLEKIDSRNIEKMISGNNVRLL